MARRKPSRVEASGGGFGATLGDLLGVAPAASAPATPAPAALPAAKGGIDLSALGRLVVKRSKKGRGGHPVVLISGLAPLGDALDPTVRTLRRDLGCAARREGDDVALTGDLTDRVIAWLEAHGARRIVRGN